MRFWEKFGPGFLLAATSIGASHLVLSPQAGALFQYHLLWLVLVCHLVKYPAFESGPRYAAATGRNLLQGYYETKGPKGWAVYIFLVSTILQGIGVLAGVVSVSGCVIWTWTGLFSTKVISIILLAAIVFLLFEGGFSWMDNINKVMMTILALATILAFTASPPPLGRSLQGLLVPSIPGGSILLVAAILGWMPTGIDVSVWHSFWSLEKFKELGGSREPPSSISSTTRKRLSISLMDMRAGYVLSLLTGIMFLCLGAVHLQGRGAELKGVQFAQAISDAYSAILGRWMHHVFMLTAFFAMFSTSYTVVDGFSRSFSEAMAVLKPGTLGQANVKKKTYIAFVLGSALFAVVTLLLVGNPVTLVTAAAMISLAAAPFLYGLNLHCIKRDISDPHMRPGRLTMAIGWFGTVFMLAALGTTFYVKVVLK
ncbi:MAG: divalent metal cation transporter [Deltaproteobacteria bacterium]|nr:divalent metal cation transporter [Deltaproteobacteria bacterium]